MLDRSRLDDALAALGALLGERGLQYELIVAGGSALLLLGLGARPTRDLDVIALLIGDAIISAAPFPAGLAEAVTDVAGVFGLAYDWLNAGPTALLEHGLPPGFEGRLVTRSYGGLTLQVVGRFDQICFKLYALADQGPRSKHAADLRGLMPTRDELLEAGRWARTHDPSPAFLQVLTEALAFLGVADAGSEL